MLLSFSIQHTLLKLQAKQRLDVKVPVSYGFVIARLQLTFYLQNVSGHLIHLNISLISLNTRNCI